MDIPVTVPADCSTALFGKTLHHTHLFQRAVRRDEHHDAFRLADGPTNRFDSNSQLDHILADLSRHKPVFILQFVGHAASVADEVTIHLFVQPRPEPINGVVLVFLAVMIDGNIAALAAAVADTGTPGQKPGTLFEAEILAGHGTNGTEVDHVKRVTVVQRPSREDVDTGRVRPVDDAEFSGLGDQAGEANAARAQHATLLVMDHATTEIHFFGLEHRFDRHAALLAIVFHVEILELAFTGLITDGAVDRVVDQLKFHDVTLDPLDVVHIEQDFHPFGRPGLAGRHNRRPPLLDAHQAQTAVAVGAQSRMIAEMRNLDTDSAKGVDQVFA